MKTTSWLSVLVLGTALIGCSSGGGSGGNGEQTAKGAEPGQKLTGEVEVVAFKGGYDIDFYAQSGEEFSQKNPGLKVTVSGDPKVWDTLRPRFVAETPPDLCFPGWGLDHWSLAEEGQLLTLDDALNGKSFDGKSTWRDTFEPSILKLGQKDGKQYVLPYYFNVMGWWYDPGFFKEKGWTVPTTYDELLVLCGKIKAAGVAPITFQGQYPYYMIEGMLLPWCMRIGGYEAIKAAENMEPGAWKSDAMLKAAGMIVELRDKGFFEEGAVAMNHTESQTEFLNRKAAMIPCGTWLDSEMRKTKPANAKMEFFLPPLPEGSGDPTAVLIGIEPWMIPAKAKNPTGAIEVFKYMTSLEKAQQFVKEKSTLMAIAGSSDVDLPEALVVPAKLFKDSKTVWAVPYRQWYPAFQTELENSVTAMLNKELTPAQFCDRVEAAAQKLRDDPNIPKHKME